MFCDVYSLGRGEVSVNRPCCRFTINHLQVLRGYRYQAVPEEVRAQACGPLGGWKPGDPDPKLEIVPHHEAPVVWPKLEPRWRTEAIQVAGTARVMVPVTNPLERRMYPEGSDPYTIDLQPGPPPLPMPDITELLPGLASQLDTLELSGGPVAGDVDPRPLEAELSERPPASAQAPELRLVGRPAEVVAAAEVAASEEVSDRCQGIRGDGTKCPRKARPGSPYCGAHGKKAVVT